MTGLYRYGDLTARAIDPTAQALLDRFLLIVSNDAGPHRDLAFLARNARIISPHAYVVLEDALKAYFEHTYLDALDADSGRAPSLLLDVLGVVRDSIDWSRLAERMLDGDYGDDWAGLLPARMLAGVSETAWRAFADATAPDLR